MFSRFQRRDFYRKVRFFGKCPFGVLLHSFACPVDDGVDFAGEVNEYWDKRNP